MVIETITFDSLGREKNTYPWYSRISIRSGEPYWVNRETGEQTNSCPIEFNKHHAFSHEKVHPMVFDAPEIQSFGSSTLDLPSLWVIGGVHGNEIHGINGTKLVCEFLQNSQYQTTQLLYDHAHITVVPCINICGYLAGARCCPMEDVKVNYINPKIVVEDHEKGAIYPPPGWQDPNRGWDVNKTVVKKHMKKILCGKVGRKPEWILFNHDWAKSLPTCFFFGNVCHPQSVPHEAEVEHLSEEILQYKKKTSGPFVSDKIASLNSLFGKRSEPKTENDIFYSGIEKIFSAFYPSTTAYGTPVKFTAEYKLNNTMPSKVYQKFNIPSIIIENYIGKENAGEAHLASSLFVLAKRANVQIDTDTLVDLILSETRSFCHN